ncbi:MAG: hypothetical protein WC812_00660 [Candidatus Pacearchaeota archaeon]|jgi:hypothetical protein
MHNCNCWNFILAIVILVFSFWKIDVSWWIIWVAAALLIIKAIFEWCGASWCCCGSCDVKKPKAKTKRR